MDVVHQEVVPAHAGTLYTLYDRDLKEPLVSGLKRGGLLMRVH